MEFVDFIKKNRDKKVLLVAHSLADADAIASAVALSTYFEEAIICVPDSMSAPGKRIAERASVKVVKFDVIDPKLDAIIILDTNTYALLPGMEKFISSFTQVALIDHHPPHSDSVKADVLRIDEKASSTCEIVYEIFREINFQIEPGIAELLIAGILADSADLKSATTRTLEVATYLLRRTKLKLSQIYEIAHGVPDASQRIAVLKAVSRARVTRAGDFIIATSEASSFEGVAADQLVYLGADYAFVAQVMHDQVRISARCRTSLVYSMRASVAEIMKEVGKAIGGSGGGHAPAAGADGPLVKNVGDALLLAEELAKNQIKDSCLKKTGKKH